MITSTDLHSCVKEEYDYADGVDWHYHLETLLYCIFCILRTLMYPHHYHHHHHRHDHRHCHHHHHYHYHHHHHHLAPTPMVPPPFG